MMGGYGYSSEYDMERLVRSTLVSTIYGGTSEIQRGSRQDGLGSRRLPGLGANEGGFSRRFRTASCIRFHIRQFAPNPGRFRAEWRSLPPLQRLDLTRRRGF